MSRTFTDDDLAELQARLAAGDASAIADAVQATKPTRQRKICTPRAEPSGLDRLKANVDSAIKAADRRGFRCGEAERVGVLGDALAQRPAERRVRAE